MSVDDEMFENKRLQMKGRMILWIVFISVSGFVGMGYMIMYRPHNPTPEVKIVVSVDDCSKLCVADGVANYEPNNCQCRPPKAQPAPHAVQIDRMDCNCACAPMNARQVQFSGNDVAPAAPPPEKK